MNWLSTLMRGTHQTGVILVVGMLMPLYIGSVRASFASEHQYSFLEQLTDKERAWLSEHEPIRMGNDPSWEPFEFIDDAGQYRGMAAEYVDLLVVAC